MRAGEMVQSVKRLMTVTLLGSGKLTDEFTPIS